MSNGIVSYKVYNKRDDFNFEIVNFQFLDGDFLGIYISQLISSLEPQVCVCGGGGGGGGYSIFSHT